MVISIMGPSGYQGKGANWLSEERGAIAYHGKGATGYQRKWAIWLSGQICQLVINII